MNVSGYARSLRSEESGKGGVGGLQPAPEERGGRGPIPRGSRGTAKIIFLTNASLLLPPQLRELPINEEFIKYALNNLAAQIEIENQLALQTPFQQIGVQDSPSSPSYRH